MIIKLYDYEKRQEELSKSGSRWSSENTCTVAELIEALKKCNPNAKVSTEGCDCIGTACSISADDNEVMIARGLNG